MPTYAGTRSCGFERTLLGAIGFFGGTAHALPDQLYLGGAMGPFDALVVVLLVLHFHQGSRRTVTDVVRGVAPFYVLATFAYIGELNGAIHFGGPSIASLIAPLRFLLYPSLFLTLVPLLRTEGSRKTIFLFYCYGVLAVALIAWVRSPDPSFFFGFPVLYNPNVIGNFIAYAMIALGFGFMTTESISKGLLLLCLFLLALVTFSKASWLLALLGIFTATASTSRARMLLFFAVCAAVAMASIDLSQLVELVSNAIDIKLASSVGDDTTGGTVYMRVGFFLSSMFALIDYPLGIGLKNFYELNQSYAHELGSLYFPSESPHTALGYVAVQAGWVGVVAFLEIFRRVCLAAFTLYGRGRPLEKIALTAMLTVSVLFQIEFLTQPFIYLLLATAASLARYDKSKTAEGPMNTDAEFAQVRMNGHQPSGES